MEKRMQVFISSTFTDLINERQHAVQAILDSNNIPAGMELFKAGNDDQLTIIKEWIDKSDIFMLILGGRYGTIEPKSGKSYTHLEYEYAIEKKKPVFTLVLDQGMLDKKFEEVGGKSSDYEKIFERENPTKYDKFKKQVAGPNKLVTFPVNVQDLKYETVASLNHLKDRYKLDGWVRASENDLFIENQKLKEEIQKLKIALEQSQSNGLSTSNNSFDSSKIEKRLNKASAGKQDFIVPSKHSKPNNENNEEQSSYTTILPNKSKLENSQFNLIKNYLSDKHIKVGAALSSTFISDKFISALEFFEHDKTLTLLYHGIKDSDKFADPYTSVVVNSLIPYLEHLELIDIDSIFDYGSAHGKKTWFYQLNNEGMKFLRNLEMLKN